MYVDGWMLLAIYFISVLALAVSAYAVWSLEEVRLHYERMYNQTTKIYRLPKASTNKHKTKSYWKK